MAIHQRNRVIPNEVTAASQDHWTRLTDILDDWVIVFSDSWIVQYINNAVVRDTKIQKSEIIGLTIWDKFPQLKTDEVLNGAKVVRKKGKVFKLEHFFTELNKWFLVNLYPIKGGIVAHMVDITKEKKNIEEKEKVTSFLESVISQMPAGLVVADAKTGKAILGNNEIEKIFRNNFLKNYNLEGYQNREGYHLNGDPILPHEWPMIRSIKYGEIVNGENIRIKRADGTDGYIRARSAPIYDKNGEIVAGVVIDTDVTDSIELQQELIRSKHEFETLANNSPDVISRFDKNMKHTYINPAVEKVAGFPPKQYIGKTSIESGVPPEIAKYWERHIKQVFKTAKPNTMEFYIFGKFFQSWLVPEFDGNKKVVSVLSVSRDMTAIKEIENKKDEFISMASHELKTPITSIKVFTELIKRSPNLKKLPKETSQLRKIQMQINKLNKLVNDLLDISRIQVGKLEVNPQKFSVNNLIREVIEIYEMKNKKNKFIVNCSENPVIYADRDRIGQVINNLIQNAIKYSPNSKEIIVESKVENNNVIISVRDFGIGIDKKYLKKIFDRFYRVYDDNDSTYPGLGMGLYIASEIIKLHHGKIYVKSKPNKGSEFSFLLPVSQ